MRRGLLLMVAATVAGLAPGGRAVAHTSLDSSAPAAGATELAPVGRVTLTFTEAVEPTADGMVVSVDGAVVAPLGITTDDGVTWELAFEPVSQGSVVVTYHVVSADGHPVSGDVTFSVNAPAPTTAFAPTTAAPAEPDEPAEPAAASTSVPVAVGAPPTVPASARATATPAAGNGADGSDPVLWIVVTAGGAALLAVLGWAAVRRKP